MGTNFYVGNSEEMRLPCLTACPFEAFKKRGFHYNEANFLKWTFEFDEIFIIDGAFNDLINKSMIQIEEVRSVFLGRCYMICSLKPVEKFEFLFLQMRKERDITGKFYFWTYCLGCSNFESKCRWCVTCID